MIDDRDGITRQKLKRHANMYGRDVLEIGCGDGRLTGIIRELEPRRLTAIDPDTDAVAAARAAFPKIDIREGSGEALDAADMSYDIVVFTFSLHHQDAVKALEEARRVLRPGGRVIILDPSGDGQYDQITRFFQKEHHALQSAIRAVAESALVRKHEEVFTTDWEFTDEKELYSFFFDYYGKVYDEAVAEKMREVLGSAAQQNPVLVRDRVRLIVLQKA